MKQKTTITEKEHFVYFHSHFIGSKEFIDFEIQNDLSQVRISNEDTGMFFQGSIENLTALKEAIDMAIEKSKTYKRPIRDIFNKNVQP